MLTRRGFIGLCAFGALAPRTQREVEQVYARSPLLRAIRDAGLAGRRLRHEERVALAVALVGIPSGVDEIHRVLHRCPNYDRTITDAHIRRLAYGRLAGQRGQERRPAGC